MNNTLVVNGIRFLVLLLVQVTICNNVNFLGYTNPYIYILFILLFPLKEYRLLAIISGFVIGLVVDWFSDSGGVHAGASVVLAYARPLILRNVFGLSYEHHNLKFNQTNFNLVLVYISIATVLHHLILFSLEIFNISKVVLILNKTLSSSVLSIIIIFLLVILFSKSKK